jgi:hypothetical protein
MSIRARKPETTTIPISHGDTITVKKHLSSGESRAMVRQMYTLHPVTGESVTADPVTIGLARVRAYLLDWTVCGPDGQPLVIWQRPADEVQAALDAIDPECYTEVLRAIETHAIAMHAERSEKKTPPAGETTSSSSSPSPSGPA